LLSRTANVGEIGILIKSICDILGDSMDSGNFLITASSIYFPEIKVGYRLQKTAKALRREDGAKEFKISLRFPLRLPASAVQNYLAEHPTPQKPLFL
jgi:hypothetical protein